MKRTILFISLLTIIATSCLGKKEEKNVEQQKTKTMTTINLTTDLFKTKVFNYEGNPAEWKYLGDKPCIIDFYATWCGPCKAVAPILEEIANEYDGKIYVYKIDVDKEEELAAAFGIRSIPTMYFCPMEGNPQIAQGALPKDVIKQAIAEVLKVE
jgi:thioredoxin